MKLHARNDEQVLVVDALRVEVQADHGIADAVRGVSFKVCSGQTLGIVGESGSGKTLTALAILGVLPKGARVAGGSVVFRGRDLRALRRETLRKLRASEFGYVPQDPHTALHPSYRIERQILEGVPLSGGGRKELEERAVRLLKAMGMPDAEGSLRRYPHELSGGMKQRVATVMALIRRPSLVIADEPTTALDVTIQVEYVEHLLKLQRETQFAMVFVSHDIGVVSNVCDEIAVMYAGDIVEWGPVERIIAQPQHPYTQALIASIPALGERATDDHPLSSGIPGRPPLPGEILQGCPFAPRCPHVQTICCEKGPELSSVSGGGQASCWRLGEL